MQRWPKGVLQSVRACIRSSLERFSRARRSTTDWWSTRELDCSARMTRALCSSASRSKDCAQKWSSHSTGSSYSTCQLPVGDSHASHGSPPAPPPPSPPISSSPTSISSPSSSSSSSSSSAAFRSAAALRAACSLWSSMSEARTRLSLLAPTRGGAEAAGRARSVETARELTLRSVGRSFWFWLRWPIHAVSTGCDSCRCSRPCSASSGL
mmetsp:Transcript_3871/g.10106  ORF Transcript_3871/g.10106 Transcript_3871/m.10106 type:complete len:210 (-) Transcript_3871:661-1290(-)